MEPDRTIWGPIADTLLMFGVAAIPFLLVAIAMLCGRMMS